MKKLLTLAALALLPACGSEDEAAPPPAPPALGAQIDRMGRAGVNTAVTNPFNHDPTTHGAVQDRFNAAPQSQFASFAPSMAANLAILDSLDTVCGNQLLAGPTATPGRYDALAGVLADDQLWVNTGSGTCELYLGVEANALGIDNNDCGGRTPLEDTIDETYSLFAAGALSGVDDGVPIDADGRASLTEFPFLAPPNP